jgi:hypothetical protein
LFWKGKGRTLLSRAARNVQKDVISIPLHGAGISKNSKDYGMRNAVFWHVKGGHTDTLHTLLTSGCGGEDDVDVDIRTLLLWPLFVLTPATMEVLLSSQ